MGLTKPRRGASLSTIPPTPSSSEYSPALADLAARILYRSPLPSQNDLRVFILDAAAFPDTNEVDYDSLLPYVLARLPGEEELIGGRGYEVVFFAGGEEPGAGRTKKARPGWGWFLQAYHVLSRAMRKRLHTLYVVHERRWIRVMVELFSTVVSPKFRKKIVHLSTLTALALYIPIENLLIPPSAYLVDRRRVPDIHVPYASGRRAFGARNPLPLSTAGRPRLPRVLREATGFLVADQNLRTEGIFRISARAVTVGILKEAYDRGQKFIVWKDRGSTLAFSHWKEGYGDVMVEEVEQAEGYGVYDAAGLIKMWYHELREPLIPQTAYQYISRAYGDPEQPLEIPHLFDLIGEHSEGSPLSKTSRQILTMHLFPLMVLIQEQQDWNKMSSQNLAICFAPTLTCGPDPIEDAKMGGVIRRIIGAVLEQWKIGLADLCGVDHSMFKYSLRIPDTIEDREDPLELAQSNSFNDVTREGQSEGILLFDEDDDDDNIEISVDEGEDDDDDEDTARPPLPPRNGVKTIPSQSPVMAMPVRRKPVPQVQAPPRYSTVFPRNSVDAQQLPAYPKISEGGTADQSESLSLPVPSPVPADTIPERVILQALPGEDWKGPR
jgi:Rho GTPase-activating protein 1